MDQFRQQNIMLVSTEFLLLEVADAFSDSAIRGLTVEYINRLRRWKNLQIIPVSQSLLGDIADKAEFVFGKVEVIDIFHSEA